MLRTYAMDSDLARLRQELEAAIAGMAESAMIRAPEGKWNSAQILEHLFLSYKGTNRGLARCLEKGSPLATRATLKQRLDSLVVIGLGYMPEGRKAPAVAMPRGTPAKEVRETIFAEIQEMESGLNEWERRFGARTKIMDHPLLGPLTASQWRRLHLVHGRHHARQIRERQRL
ncbi:MAG: DUF1569 domain-containing protein [Terriglobales bacterium]